MYKHQTADDHKRLLGVKDDYRVDALIIMGTHPKTKEYPHLIEALKSIGAPYKEEEIKHQFFQDIKVFVIGKKRIWFDVAYGAAYLSEIVHIASMLGSQSNILIGSCGALQDNMHTGDTVLVTESFGDESATRMYERTNTTHVFPANKNLYHRIEKNIEHRKTIHRGRLISVQAMLGETESDVLDWKNMGYIGVDMESATLFAVSHHFEVPAAALLYVADNLIKNELVGGQSYEAFRAQRLKTKKENYEIALKVALE